MERKFPVDINKLNDVFDNPELEKKFQEVFSFVESITGQKSNPDDLTPKNIETWSKKFDEVLKELFSTERGMDDDKKKKTQKSRNQEEILKKAYLHNDISKS